MFGVSCGPIVDTITSFFPTFGLGIIFVKLQVHRAHQQNTRQQKISPIQGGLKIQRYHQQNLESFGLLVVWKDQIRDVPQRTHGHFVP
eukprot:TRINITY_DN8110_c0_g1_i1.p1 TRINITY_DN8110_c0_g1~~TRINITY_DN8110_c0_g1_i1.p1  ORF type:complete len:88 (-),score=5.06 TRINITY_DN8110_c0_g1_i1:477-740(-)